MLDKIKDKLKNYIKEKKDEKQFMKEIKKEALLESKEDIKAGIKEKIKNDYVKKMTTSRGEKLKGAFNMNALGDVNAKLDRMIGKTGTSTNMSKMMGNDDTIKPKKKVVEFDIKSKLDRMIKR